MVGQRRRRAPTNSCSATTTGRRDGLYFTHGVPVGGANPDAWAAGNPDDDFPPCAGRRDADGRRGVAQTRRSCGARCTSFGVQAVINPGRRRTQASSDEPVTDVTTRCGRTACHDAIRVNVWTAANVPASTGPNPVTITWDWIRREQLCHLAGSQLLRTVQARRARRREATASFSARSAPTPRDPASIESLSFDVPFQSTRPPLPSRSPRSRSAPAGRSRSTRRRSTCSGSPRRRAASCSTATRTTERSA